MPIREDLVASAAQFLQDPSVAASPVENRIAFLKAKNLTEEEIEAALARPGGDIGKSAQPSYAVGLTGSTTGPQPSFYGGYRPYGWQLPPREPPRRDWRDWFIMATVVGGVGYGLYALGKRYVYPLIAPPTPERLEADKKSIDEQFEKAFTLVDQLAKDTEILKAVEQQRTEKLDSALAELETVINDLKSSNRRRDDEAYRIRDDLTNLKDSIPKAMDAQKNLTNNRLQEVNAELKSLKTILGQRMASQQTSSVNNPASRAVAPAPASTPTAVSSTHDNETNGPLNGQSIRDDSLKRNGGDQSLSAGHSSPRSSAVSSAGVKIPEWQRAMAAKKSSISSSNTFNIAAADTGSSSQVETGGGGS